MDALAPPAELNRGAAARPGPPAAHPARGASTIARSALVALLLALFVRAFLLEVVSIPSASMMPTLEPGDQVLVNRFLYSGPRFGLLPRRPVRRGDVVLFRPPFDRRQEFVKRCVGSAGRLGRRRRARPGGALDGGRRAREFARLPAFRGGARERPGGPGAGGALVAFARSGRRPSHSPAGTLD